MAFDATPSDVLLTLAEISVAFAGFSSIVAIFQRRQAADSAAFDVFRFWIMLEFSVVALFFALLPFSLAFFELPETAMWRFSSGAMLLFIVIHTQFVRRLIRRGGPDIERSMTPWLTVAAGTVYLLIMLSQLVNALGLPWPPRFGPYVVGLLLLLLSAGVNFVRLVWVGSPGLR